MYEFINARHFAIFVGIEANKQNSSHEEFIRKYIAELNLGEYVTSTDVLMSFRRGAMHRVGFFEENEKFFMLATVDNIPGVYAVQIDGIQLVTRYYPDADVHGPFEKWRPEIKMEYHYDYPLLKRLIEKQTAFLSSPMALHSYLDSLIKTRKENDNGEG